MESRQGDETASLDAYLFHRDLRYVGASELPAEVGFGLLGDPSIPPSPWTRARARLGSFARRLAAHAHAHAH